MSKLVRNEAGREVPVTALQHGEVVVNDPVQLVLADQLLPLPLGVALEVREGLEVVKGQQLGRIDDELEQKQKEAALYRLQVAEKEATNYISVDYAKAAHKVATVEFEQGLEANRRHPGTGPLPAVIVEDTKVALGALAQHWRSRFAPVLIGIAGSNGKTTTKEMLAAILRRHAGDEHVLATRGNLNNDIGLPLTLLRLRAAHRYCAIELGMNHKGEIAVLADIAKPTIALVTNAQREHLEFMRSVDEVAEENADVYRALPTDGVAVINIDDERAGIFRAAAGARHAVEFGLNTAASVSGGYALKQLSSDMGNLSHPCGTTFPCFLRPPNNNHPCG